MRGDSIRDLHAKVLALCGLGLLAGAGALVDYWPVQDPLPRVASGATPVQPIRPRAVPATPREFIASATPASRRTVRPAATARPSMRRGPAAGSVTAVAEHSVTTPAPPVPSAARATPDRADLPVMQPAAFMTQGTIALEAPKMLEPVSTFALPVSAVTRLTLQPPAPPDQASIANHRANDDGLITGALKKTGAVAGAGIARTGDVLARTGAVAGASILGAFRGLAGIVKKVSPFGP